jgi:hypothetical protein
MKLFHWKSQGIDFLVVAGFEQSARAAIKTNVLAWRWQNPARFDMDVGPWNTQDAVLKDIEGPPYYVADPAHVITIDSLARGA